MLRKTGPYVGPGSSDNKLEWVQNAPVVKAFVDPEVLDYVKPGTITIFRHYFPDQNIWRNGADVAREVIAAAKGRRPDYFELYNECNQFVYDNLARYLQMHKEAAPVIHAYGSKLLLGNFSTQQPPDESLKMIKDSNYGDCDGIAIHGYWTSDANGARFNEDSALKHRHMHRFWGEGHPDIFITECGRDKVEGIAQCNGDDLVEPPNHGQ